MILDSGLLFWATLYTARAVDCASDRRIDGLNLRRATTVMSRHASLLVARRTDYAFGVGNVVDRIATR